MEKNITNHFIIDVINIDIHNKNILLSKKDHLEISDLYVKWYN